MGKESFMVQEERRKHRRVKADIAIAIQDADSNVITETRDISVSGIACKTNKVFSEMSRVEITLLIPGQSKGKTVTRKVTCQGVVVRHQALKKEAGFYDMAIFFTEVGKADFRILEKYVDLLASQQDA